VHIQLHARGGDLAVSHYAEDDCSTYSVSGSWALVNAGGDIVKYSVDIRAERRDMYYLVEVKTEKKASKYRSLSQQSTVLDEAMVLRRILIDGDRAKLAYERIKAFYEAKKKWTPTYITTA